MNLLILQNLRAGPGVSNSPFDHEVYPVGHSTGEGQVPVHQYGRDPLLVDLLNQGKDGLGTHAKCTLCKVYRAHTAPPGAYALPGGGVIGGATRAAGKEHGPAPGHAAATKSSATPATKAGGAAPAKNGAPSAAGGASRRTTPPTPGEEA